MFKIYISDSVFQGIKSAESLKPASSRSNLYKLLLQQPVQVLSGTETSNIMVHPEDVLKHPSSLYILDINDSEALAIQKRYGVMCLGGNAPDIAPLIDINDIHIADKYQKLGRGWDSVLDSIEPLPSNALLLTDRYLFSERRPNSGDGIANTRSILSELLPLQFEGGNYHVTIVFDNQSKHYSYTFADIIRLLEQVKKQLKRNYPITMEVLGITKDCPIYPKLHNRRIVSNYYIVEASHKIAAFNKDIGTTPQTLLPLALFTEDSLNDKSTPPLDAIIQTLKPLRDFSKSLPTRYSHDDYLYAVNGKRMEKCNCLRNRLLKQE